MALTRPTFNNINSNALARFNDPLVVLNAANVSANNQDIGLIFNRGSSGNVALYWNETTDAFTLAYTTTTGQTDGNIALTSNANLQVGNLIISGSTTHSGAISGTDLTLSGNLTVNGTVATINSTTVTVNDKNIVVANNQSTSANIDGAGIDAGGGTPIATWRYNNATTSWQSNVGITPAATNTLSLGGASNYWTNIYSTTHTGTTGTFSGTISAAAINAATIGNSGATFSGASGTWTGTLAAATVNAATIGNTGALITGTLQTASQTNITGVGNITTGTWSATLGSISGASLTSLTAGNLTGTIPSAVLGNSTHYVGTTAITLNRASATQSLTGVSIDGSASTVTTAAQGNITSVGTLIGLNATGNISTSGNVVATGKVYGAELNATSSAGDEGGQINMALAATNTTLTGNVVIDVYQNKLRFFEGGGTTRGVYIDLTQAASSANTNLLSGTVGGANTYVQFNDGGVFGGNSQFTYDKNTSTLTASIVAATSNGAGTNFKVGDDVYIGDINSSNTMGIKGQQDGTQGYIVFGNTNATNYIGRSGSNPITVTGAFSVTGTLTGTTINAATIGNSGASLTGTLQTAAQTNITSVGTLTGLTLSGTLNGTTLQAATIGNVGSAHIGASISAATIGNAGATLTGSTVNAATIGNTGATLTGSTVNAATIGNTGASLIGTLSNALTFNNGGAGVTSGSTYSGNTAVTISHNTIGAAPQAGNASIVTVGNIVSGTWSATLGSISGAALTNLTAGQLSGTIPSAVLGNSTHYVGTTAITLNRASATQSLTGVSIDGSASTVTTAAQGNITSVGTLTGLTLSGTLNGTTVQAATIGNSGATLYGTLNSSSASQPNITTLAGLTGFGTAAVVTTAAGDLAVTGNLLVNGTTVTINATSVTTNDKNIVVANNQTTSSGIDGAGIDAGGGTPIATWRYSNATTSWQSNVAITPAANASVNLGGTGNYWNNGYFTGITYSGQITSTVATGTAPLAVTSTTTVTNLSADLLDGSHKDTAYNSFGNGTIPLRHSSGYLYSNYFNMTADQTTGAATRIAVETSSDNFLRWQTPAQFITNSKIVDWKNHTAQCTLHGGGTVTYNSSGYILWGARVIAIPVENTEYSASGYIDINCPTSGTVTYYNSAGVTTTVTCTAAGIPIAAWEALYYQVTEGQTSASDQTKFRVVNYQNTVWSPGPGWLLLAARNGDDNTLRWLPGQVSIPLGGVYTSSTGLGNWQAPLSNGNVTVGNVTVTGALYRPLPTVLNDISNQFNGINSVFPLKVNQTSYTGIIDSKDVEVIVAGRRLSPYVTELRYPWLTPYDSYPGFKISGSNLIIYSAPEIGAQATVTVLNTSTAKQTRRYPYSAASIALGD